MNSFQFAKTLQNEIQSAMDEGWLCSDDFETHKSCDHSDFHGKIVALISYVLQENYGLHTKHEIRLWRSCAVDIVAFKKHYSSFIPYAIFEYESPNSYLHLNGCHIGKDISHYFEYQNKYQKGLLSEYSNELNHANWYIISTLPKHDVVGKIWKYRKNLGSKKNRASFMKNPFKHMVPLYSKLYSKTAALCKRPIRNRNSLYMLNLSIEDQCVNLRPYRLLHR
jgi:hypothetical protein